MKTFLLILGSCILLSSSCEKEDLAPRLRRETAEKIMGKWMVERTINQVYDPLPTLSSTKESAGTADDFFDFKTDALAEVKSAASGSKMEEYMVWNPYQVKIGDVSWRIEELTQTGLVLLWDRNDAARYMRFVTKVNLVRSP
jgi:hypothetical protein